MNNNKNGLLLKLAVLSIGLQDMGGGAASPALADIIKAFPSVDPTTIMLIQTLPAAAMVVISPIYGKLINYFRKRALLFFSFACFLIGGTVPAFLGNLYAVLAMRALLGVGIGILLPMSVGLIADFYDGQERDTLMGMQMTVSAIGGMFFQLAGGFLAAIDWHYCFYTYLFVLVVWAFNYFYLPEPGTRRLPIGEKSHLPEKVYGICFGYIIYTILLLVYVTNIAVFIVGEQLGNAGNAGIALTLFTLGSMAAGLVFGKLLAAIKGYIMSFAYFVTGLGFIMCFVGDGLSMIYAGSLLTGLGMGFTIPAYYCRVSVNATPSTVAFGLSLIICAQGLGQFIQPYVLKIVLKIISQPIGRPTFIVSAVGLLALAVIFALVNALFAKQNSEIREICHKS